MTTPERMTTAAAAPEIDPRLLPNAKELRALRLFVSMDEARPHLATLWQYTSDGGVTYVATDGHTMVVRRSGTHRTTLPIDIAKLEPRAVDDQGAAFATVTVPPGWPTLLHAPHQNKMPAKLGMNPDYFARVGEVERAAGQRAADDFEPRPGMTGKWAKQERANLKNGAFAEWMLPSDPLGGWFWRLDSKTALWEGLIMPRRV